MLACGPGCRVPPGLLLCALTPAVPRRHAEKALRTCWRVYAAASIQDVFRSGISEVWSPVIRQRESAAALLLRRRRAALLLCADTVCYKKTRRRLSLQLHGCWSFCSDFMAFIHV